MAPRPFGPYEVLARLATGGAANIFLARQPMAGGSTLCVLKTLLPERVADHEFVEMFLDEARLAARLAHPSCVEIYDLGKEGGTYYIAMEYIVGETLWGLLSSVPEARAPLPPLVVASIIAAAAEGLHHAHELEDPAGNPYNLVHRDVSPQNIMVSYDGQTKVLDFGIAKGETGREATANGIVKGKFSYMSPEQITGGALDRRSDVYSLGIVLFECLAARRLYRADSPEDIARMMLERKPPRLRDVVPDMDPALEAITSKALSRHPTNRFSTAREMADALREVMHQHRFAEGTVPIARLVEERFGPRIAERRRVIEHALEGTEDEAELLRVLNARPVMEIDLHPPEASETPHDGTPIEGSFDRQGARVELRSTGTPPESIRLSVDAPRLVPEESEGGATRLEGDMTVLEGVTSNALPPAPPPRMLQKKAAEPETKRVDVERALADADVPLAVPRKKSLSSPPRSDPRAPTRMPPVKPSKSGSTPSDRLSSALTSPHLPGNTDPFGGAMVQVPPRLIENPSTAGGDAIQLPALTLDHKSGSDWDETQRPPDKDKIEASSSVTPSVASGPPGGAAPLPPPPAFVPQPAAAMASLPAAPPHPGVIEPLSAPHAVHGDPQMYSLGVVLAAMAFGVTLGLLLGVLITLFTRP